MKAKKFISIILALVLSFSFVSVANAAGSTSAPFENSEFFEMGGYSIHYRFIEHEGTFAGRIVFIHGMISSTVIWENMADIMSAQGYDCLLVDLPGFGYSTRETRDVDPVPREDLVAALMQELAGNEKWIIAGHSMGGGTSLTIAQKYPELLESMLLYAPAGNSSGTNLPEPLTYFMGGIMNMMYKAVLSIASNKLFVSYINKYFGYDADYDLNGKWLEPLKIADTGMSMMYMTRRVTPIDYEVIKGLTIPVLLCVADADTIVANDSDSALAVENGLPAHAKKVVVEGGNHLFVELMANEVTELTLTFLG